MVILENTNELITIIITSLGTIASLIIAIVNFIKKVKAVKTTDALNFLNEVHELADSLMLEIENSRYKGEEKKNAVIYNVVRKIPNADVEELAKYIDMKIAFTKEINVK